jgi:hypothetical protein
MAADRRTDVRRQTYRWPPTDVQMAADRRTDVRRQTYRCPLTAEEAGDRRRGRLQTRRPPTDVEKF